MINQCAGSAERPPQFTRGYGLSFGHCERKTMAMALVDRALRARELDESIEYPAQDEEFVLYHSDSVEASGFVQHLKDRKSVVSGKSVSVRVDLGGRRTIK